jgi:hypothetical protein
MQGHALCIPLHARVGAPPCTNTVQQAPPWRPAVQLHLGAHPPYPTPHTARSTSIHRNSRTLFAMVQVMPHPPGIASHSEEADDRALYVNRKDALSVSAAATASTIHSGGGGSGADAACPPPRQALPPGGRRGTPTSSSSGGRLGSTRSQTARAARMAKVRGLQLQRRLTSWVVQTAPSEPPAYDPP